MTTTVDDALAGGTSIGAAHRTVRPVIGWALLGVLFLVIEGVSLGGWVLYGDAKSTSPGPSPVPDWMRFTIGTVEVIAPIVGVVFIYLFMIRPWRREGHITTDGLLMIGFLTIFWQDPMANCFQTWFVWNPQWVNLGSWTTHVPGWLSPGANRGIWPLLYGPPGYIFGVFGAAVLGCAVMRKSRARWPTMGNLGIVMICYAMFVALDLGMDFVGLFAGFYTFPGGIEWLTLFHGHYYQLPIYHVLLAALWWLAFACFRFFRDSEDRLVVERGIERTGLTGWKRSGLKLLAIIAALNLGSMIYNVPASISGLYASPWPKEITDVSYRNGGMCGPGTSYACPGPGVPIPRRDSAHLGPTGKLVVPARDTDSGRHSAGH